MLTLKDILAQSCVWDWFITVDLKDAYFHIQVVKQHRWIHRFAFGDKAYQYRILPFGLALTPWTFTECMDAALAPLRLQGIRVLNYLDDWLILAQSNEFVCRDKDILLHHLQSLGLRVNAQKSVLTPSQQTVFLGSSLILSRCRQNQESCLAPAQVLGVRTCFKGVSKQFTPHGFRNFFQVCFTESISHPRGSELHSGLPVKSETQVS